MAGISLNELASKLAQPLIQGATPLTGKSKLDYLGMDSDDSDSSTVATGDDIDAVQKSVAGIKTDVDGLKTDVSKLKGDVSEQGSEISANTNNIATNTSDIKAVKTEVSALKDQVSDQKDAISDNANNIATNTSEIDQLKRKVGVNNPLTLITSIPDLSSGTNIDPSTVANPWTTKKLIVQLYKTGNVMGNDPLPSLTIDTPLSGTGTGLSVNHDSMFGSPSDLPDFKIIMELEYLQWGSTIPWYYYRFSQAYQLKVSRLVVGYSGVVEDHFTAYGGGTVTVGTDLDYGSEWSAIGNHYYYLPNYQQDINDIEIDYTDTDGSNYNSATPILALITTGAWLATYSAGMWTLDTTGGSGGVYIAIYKGKLLVAKNSLSGQPLSTNRYLYTGSGFAFSYGDGLSKLSCDNGDKTVANLSKFINILQ